MSMDSSQSSETKNFIQLLRCLLRSRGTQPAQVMIEFIPWFSKQGILDVDNWKSIGSNVKSERGDKNPCQSFCKLEYSNILL